MVAPNLKGVSNLVRDTTVSLNPFLENILSKERLATETKITPNDFGNYLKYLQNKTGKNLIVQPFNQQFPQVTPNTLGAFFPEHPTGGLFNPPNKSNERNVFLAPGASYETLAHEVGHARDPDLRMLNARQKTAQTGFFDTPTDYLQHLFINQIQPNVKAETEAQQYGAKTVREYAALNSNLGIDAQSYKTNPWFKGYPSSYADEAIQHIYSLSAPQYQVTNPTDALEQPATRIFVRQTGTPLGLGLDSAFQQKTKEVQDWTSKYVNSMLDQF